RRSPRRSRRWHTSSSSPARTCRASRPTASSSRRSISPPRASSWSTETRRARPLAEPVDPLTNELGSKPLEKLLRIRPPRFREQHLPSKVWKELRQLFGVACLVEQVRAENEIPRSGAEQGLRLAPADAREA